MIYDPKTFFGLEVVNGCGVRPLEINGLPFVDFWNNGAPHSSQIKDRVSNEWLLPVTEWNEFARHFIATGKHIGANRSLPYRWHDNNNAATERTYFGLEVIDKKMVREPDIAKLPFVDFWRESRIGSAHLTDLQTHDHLVYLRDWQAFSELFIKTGKHRYMPQT